MFCTWFCSKRCMFSIYQWCAHKNVRSGIFPMVSLIIMALERQNGYTWLSCKGAGKVVRSISRSNNQKTQIATKCSFTPRQRHTSQRETYKKKRSMNVNTRNHVTLACHLSFGLNTDVSEAKILINHFKFQRL